MGISGEEACLFIWQEETRCSETSNKGRENSQSTEEGLATIRSMLNGTLKERFSDIERRAFS
jgi:hypothetical protein